MWCLCVCSGSLVAGSVCLQTRSAPNAPNTGLLCVCNRYTVLCVAACKCSPSRFGTCRVCSPSRFGGRPCVCSVCGVRVLVQDPTRVLTPPEVRPHTCMLLIESDKFVSNIRNCFPFFVNPRTSEFDATKIFSRRVRTTSRTYLSPTGDGRRHAQVCRPTLT